MNFIKNSFGVFLFVCFCWSNVWVLQYKNKTFYEKDFYNYFSEKEWLSINDSLKKQDIFSGFLKQSAAVYEAKQLNLHLEPKTKQKIDARFDRLLVNEYYMQSFIGDLVSDKDLRFCHKNLKKEVFINHILIKDTNSFYLTKELEDSLLLGKSFKSLALSFSEDPSVKNNGGALGWLGLGVSVPSFEKEVFNLCVGCVSTIITPFGHHVVRVDSVRKSLYGYIGELEYDNFVFRFAANYITSPLKVLAERHDSLLLRRAGVSFNFEGLSFFIDSLVKPQGRNDVDFVGLLGGVDGGLLLYKNNVLSGRWAANKLGGAFYKNVYFDSVESFVKELNLIFLRDLVKDLALEQNISNSFSFQKQFSSVKNALLEKVYLKYLINSVKKPTKNEVESFYYKYEKERFVNKNTGEPFGFSSAFGSAEAMLLKEKQDSSSNVFFSSLYNGNTKTNEEWLYGF